MVVQLVCAGAHFVQLFLEPYCVVLVTEIAAAATATAAIVAAAATTADSADSAAEEPGCPTSSISCTTGVCVYVCFLQISPARSLKMVFLWF